jgi:hypothetical protein
MTRTHAWIGVAIFIVALMALLTIPQITAAQQPTCADHTRQMQAVNLARRINSLEINSRTGVQPLGAFPNVVVPDGLSVQFLNDSAHWQFSVKDTQDACHFAVFSDQEQMIYTAQPLQPTP